MRAKAVRPVEMLSRLIFKFNSFHIKILKPYFPYNHAVPHFLPSQPGISLNLTSANVMIFQKIPLFFHSMCSPAREYP